MKVRYLVPFAASLFGAGDAGYLWYERITVGVLACPVTGGGCSAVQMSTYAAPFGIPIAAVGLLGYLIIAAVSVFLMAGYTTELNLESVLAILIGGAALTSLVLIGVQAFLIHAFCIWCLLSAGGSFIMAMVFLPGYISQWLSPWQAMPQ